MQDDVESVTIITLYDNIVALIYFFNCDGVSKVAKGIKISPQQVFENLQALEVLDKHFLLLVRPSLTIKLQNVLDRLQDLYVSSLFQRICLLHDCLTVLLF